GGTLITVGPAGPTPPTPASLFDFIYRYNDGRDYYYGMVADNGTFGYQVGQQLGMPVGTYQIFNQEPGTTAAAAGSVFVSYYCHSGGGMATTTPLHFASGLPSGVGGLGTEADLMLGTDGRDYAFSSTQEASLPSAGLFGFTFSYPDGSAFYNGTVADNGTFGYGAIADGSGTKLIFDAAGHFDGYYTIYRLGSTTLPAGTVTLGQYFSVETGQSYIADPTQSGGSSGLGSESGVVTINGVQVAFGDPPEAPIPTGSQPTWSMAGLGDF